MALTREIGSRQLVTGSVTLTQATPFAPIIGSDIERRGLIVYVDPNATIPAYLADTEQHARNQSNGVPMFPTKFPPGFELGCAGAVFVYANKADIVGSTVTVYYVIELGQAADDS